jgi:hypothetical protein
MFRKAVDSIIIGYQDNSPISYTSQVFRENKCLHDLIRGYKRKYLVSFVINIIVILLVLIYLYGTKC